MTPVPATSLFASTAICSANSLVGETMSALMSSAVLLGPPLPRTILARSGSSLRMFCRMGKRKAMVLPVPVLACAMMSVPFSAALMVLA